MPPTPEDPLSAASLMKTIDGYSALPNHLSGTANSAAAESEFQANLAAAGLTLGEQAFTFPRFALEAVGLSRRRHDGPGGGDRAAPLLGDDPGGRHHRDRSSTAAPRPRPPPSPRAK